jgi:hypothetical protein
VGVKEQKTHVYKQNLNNILDVFYPITEQQELSRGSGPVQTTYLYNLGYTAITIGAVRS